MRGVVASDPADLGLLEAAALLAAGALSAVELTEACLERIAQRNGGAPSHDGTPDAVNAWVRVYPELAREQALSADRRRRREARATPRLCGIPLALKDLYGVAGLALTASSRVLDDNIADRDAIAWARLRDQGMVLLGHTHTHEFAAGGTTDQVGNPWSISRVVGGSSGGSAAALAARMTPAALGTDTCGSLRIPSACCGTSAIKPSRGCIPIDGIIPLAPSLDHPGPMGRTVADCSALLQGLLGSEPAGAPPIGQPVSSATLPSAPSSGRAPLAGLTIALTDRTESIPIEPEVAAGLLAVRDACARLGAHVIELPAPWAVDWNALSVILLTEVWVYHSRYAERHDRYRPAIAEMVEASRNFTDAQAYLAAQQRRAEGAAAWERWFDCSGVDLVLEPTLPITPYERGPGYDRGHAGGPGDPMIALTSLWDLTGMPVVSLPVSWNVGVSLVALRGREAPLIQAAIDLQERELGVPILDSSGPETRSALVF